MIELDDMMGSVNTVRSLDNENIEPLSKKVTLFDYLSDITYGKTGRIHKEKDPEMKQFNSFMILRFLSLEEGYLPFINILNMYQGVLSKEEMYKSLLLIVPRAKKFLKYPESKKQVYDDKTIEYIQEYFKCARYEAIEFIELHLLNAKDVSAIVKSFGGKEK